MLIALNRYCGSSAVTWPPRAAGAAMPAAHHAVTSSQTDASALALMVASWGRRSGGG
ncbi:MAG: hypothetical protein KatS3mg010_0068 [Acidimicrobiia bacterium]|nr:MAG: hypothetical protein KatS3mg010_0068 [Acidimicrobiia bacterium]